MATALAAGGAATAGITGAAGLGSSLMGSYAQEKISDEAGKKQLRIARENIKAQKEMQEKGLAEGGRQFDVQTAMGKRAYEDALKSYQESKGMAGGYADIGEEAFLGEAGQALPELEAAKQDILSGESEALQTGTSQLQANLAQQGVRGGQAATQLRRGVGDITTGAMKDINRMAVDEAATRQAQRLAYQRAKAQLGQQGSLSRL